ncbi:hypothetical protein KJ032_27065, partial [Salmonella enterica subsp. enterica serovar Typhimurium]|nr:hypothetical protein [Salmonella enterica subsp. enterica serovar Typhimurium]
MKDRREQNDVLIIGKGVSVYTKSKESFFWKVGRDDYLVFGRATCILVETGVVSVITRGSY